MRIGIGESRVASASLRGVSLLGVLLSLCGIAVLAIWAIPAFFERGSVTLDNLSVLLARDLRSAQNRATLLGNQAHFVFDRDGWRALDESGGPLLGEGETHEIVRRFSHDAVFDGVEIERFDFGAEGRLDITARGMVVCGGNLVLRFRDERREIQIQRGSGQVIVAGSDEPLLNDRH
jgi:hypothetical protein